jgi:S-adenosylmethionine hydrolase
MKEKKIITLLTDFGLSDVYVGVMKGVIAQINPELNVVDLTHQIPPQNIAAASFNLMNAYPYFPVGTVHIAVVDPGVGSQRKAIAIQLDRGFLVGPDNGLFSGILTQNSVVKAVELTNQKYWQTSAPSTTFHGRDIFASVGAHLANGVDLEELGSLINPENLVKLTLPKPTAIATGIVGYIQYIDHFGNLVTNISATDLQGKNWRVIIGDNLISASLTYSDSQTGEIVALIGSHGWLEIAINGGSAQSQLQLDWGARVEIRLF